MQQSWSRQSCSRVVDASSDQMEEYFHKEISDAMGKRESPTVKKSKRYRSAFTTDQVNYLESEFKKFPYIGTAQRKEVANALNIPERAVKIWFQNRRMKEKKDVPKDQNDEQIIRKNVEFVNDKLNNMMVMTMPSTNDPCYSLPQLTEPLPNNIFHNHFCDRKTEDIVKVEPNVAKEPEPLKLNYYSDISPVRDAHSSKVQPPLTTPPITNNPQFNYRSSAEFSIDLCKKYRNNNSNKPKPVPVTPPQVYSKESIAQHPQLPEDLSCRPNATKHQEPSSPRNADANNPSYIPVYVNYPQPYLSAGNMLWKPVNVLPIMPTGVPAVNMSSKPGSSSTSPEEKPKKQCHCDCHTELSPALPIAENSSNTQAQYVIATMPFQNYPKF